MISLMKTTAVVLGLILALPPLPTDAFAAGPAARPVPSFWQTQALVLQAGPYKGPFHRTSLLTWLGWAAALAGSVDAASAKTAPATFARVNQSAIATISEGQAPWHYAQTIAAARGDPGQVAQIAEQIKTQFGDRFIPGQEFAWADAPSVLATLTHSDPAYFFSMPRPAYTLPATHFESFFRMVEAVPIEYWVMGAIAFLVVFDVALWLWNTRAQPLVKAARQARRAFGWIEAKAAMALALGARVRPLARRYSGAIGALAPLPFALPLLREFADQDANRIGPPPQDATAAATVALALSVLLGGLYLWRQSGLKIPWDQFHAAARRAHGGWQATDPRLRFGALAAGSLFYSASAGVLSVPAAMVFGFGALLLVGTPAIYEKVRDWHSFSSWMRTLPLPREALWALDGLDLHFVRRPAALRELNAIFREISHRTYDSRKALDQTLNNFETVLDHVGASLGFPSTRAWTFYRDAVALARQGAAVYPAAGEDRWTWLARHSAEDDRLFEMAAQGPFAERAYLAYIGLRDAVVQLENATRTRLAPVWVLRGGEAAFISLSLAVFFEWVRRAALMISVVLALWVAEALPPFSARIAESQDPPEWHGELRRSV